MIIMGTIFPGLFGYSDYCNLESTFDNQDINESVDCIEFKLPTFVINLDNN